MSIAPPDIDLEVCVMDRSGVHALILPVRRNKKDWVDAETKKRIDVMPTHWRKWNDSRQRLISLLFIRLECLFELCLFLRE